MTTLTQAELKQRLTYNPDTGEFHRAISRGRSRKGDPAGSVNRKGYVAIRAGGRKHYMAHRLAWLYVYGVWPTGEIDHFNGVKSDNRIANLRDVSTSVNKQNSRCRGYTRCSTSSVNPWKAQIRLDGRLIYLGIFPSEDAAREAYLAAKRRLHAPGGAW